MADRTEGTPAKKSGLRCRCLGQVGAWLNDTGGSLAITTYTSGKLVLLSCLEGELKYRTQHFARPMGIAFHNNRLALAVRESILLFRKPKKSLGKFVLERDFTTGKVDAHDVAFGQRAIFFANTRYNMIAKVSKQKRFTRHWQPPFIEGLVRGDRCHLNGLGVRDGQPRLATAFCESGQKAGWRADNRFRSGVVLDIEENSVVSRGLCMPHSPRWHDGRWWLCNSGHGELATLDPQTGRCDVVCSLPGFTRGLCLVGDHALVGLSKIRRKHVLDAPPVRKANDKLMAGVALVHLPTGKMVGQIEFMEGGREVFEIVFLPGVTRPGLTMPEATTDS